MESVNEYLTARSNMILDMPSSDFWKNIELAKQRLEAVESNTNCLEGEKL